jgi:TonB dependent receptor/TonB-dependent Receptor Plug Domain/CarboxypepD_reg-like domain
MAKYPTKRRFSLLLFFFYAFLSLVSAQKNVVVSGYIEDAASSEKLISAIVYAPKLAIGEETNNYGFFSLNLPKGEQKLTVTYVGYQPLEMTLNLRGDTSLTFKLIPLELETVTISAKKQDRIENKVQMSQMTVPIEQIKKLPALLGEVDILKALQLLPGVKSGGEGQNGLYVRGGSPDQNLIMLDGVPLYNVSHVGGFVSIFNGDAIRNVTLTKGGFPARFGGRLSSVIEIDMKEGNMNQFHGEGGIGTLASRFTLEGPILKNKASFMVSGRRTYIDLLARPLIKSINRKANQKEGTNNDIGLRLSFYDLNAKVNYKINDKHRIYLSAYTGDDGLGIYFKQQDKGSPNYTAIDGTTDWGNLTTAFRWNYAISNKLFMNTTLTYSRFQFNVGSRLDQKEDTVLSYASAKYTSGIRDVAAKMDFDYSLNNNNRIRFGGGVTQHNYNPGAYQVNVKFNNAQLDTALGSTKTLTSVEPYLYVEDDVQLGAFKANIGLHFSAFSVGTKTYSALQPRLGLNYLLKNDVAVKASFATMYQYINLLTNEGFSLPTDLWVPSTERIKPQDSWQVALGIAKTIKDKYELSIEGYYKAMNNVISYREGSSFLGFDTDWQDKVTQGKGNSYGTEVFLQKKEGKTTGWLGYTLSWTNRQFANENPDLAINAGKWFPFKYDRRHDLSVVVTHQFSKKITLSGVWVYGTGNAISLPETVFNAPNDVLNNNFDINPKYEILGEKNAYRMPNNHRLDVNCAWTKKKKRWTRTWNLGAYNAYSRANPYAVFLGSKTVKDTQGNAQQIPTFRQFSFLPIVPYLTYAFKF